MALQLKYERSELLKRLVKNKWFLAILAAIVAIATYFANIEEEKIWVSIAAAHYLPPHHRIDEFLVNHRDYGNSGFDGYAGMGACCVWLPLHWKPGLVVDVRWVVSDWSDSPIDDKENFDYGKVKLVGIYRAKVPVERYEVADDVFVHFFEDGKVRVAPGVRDFRDKRDMKRSKEMAARSAVVGQKVNEMYTESPPSP